MKKLTVEQELRVAKMLTRYRLESDYGYPGLITDLNAILAGIVPPAQDSQPSEYVFYTGGIAGVTDVTGLQGNAETEAPAQPEPQEGRFRSLQQVFEEGYSEGMNRREEQVERLSIQLKGMHEHYNYLCKTIADAKMCDPMQPVIIEREAAPVPPVEPSCPDCGHSFKDNMHGFDQNDAHIEDDRLVHSGRCTYCKVCNPDPPAPTPTSREIAAQQQPRFAELRQKLDELINTYSFQEGTLNCWRVAPREFRKRMQAIVAKYEKE